MTDTVITALAHPALLAHHAAMREWVQRFDGSEEMSWIASWTWAVDGPHRITVEAVENAFDRLKGRAWEQWPSGADAPYRITGHAFAGRRLCSSCRGIVRRFPRRQPAQSSTDPIIQ